MQEYVQNEAAKWGERSEYLNVYFFTHDLWEKHFRTEVFGDILLMAVSITLVTCYSFLVLGSFSPVHFRSLSAIVGLGCILLSTVTGYSVAFLLG